MRYLFALVVLFAATLQPAVARCADDFRTFTGVVTDKAGAPLADTAVGISWSELEGPAGPALAVTDSKGRYVIPVYFSTYSGKGRIYEDECKFKVRRVSVAAYRAKLRSPYTQVAIGDKRSVALPVTVIWLPLDKEPVVQLIRPGG
ncbi:peptidase associated/transthyretin-like domain-containing protein [Lysobacter solisilvae (ex Woo and Kim 2020)]|uniref:Carboxypeptidase regulatory-like domain-containing protein n=1 Tax=Agrilutibacter terrestris TaxID=2865112 RepID=A0A7H0FVZ1_9GAMM|nr:hypothetical protein [Lysobacter terrestris]QNP40207.1 hypothetical protein H8B22_12020 [Lysobacter terrestris]